MSHIFLMALIVVCTCGPLVHAETISIFASSDTTLNEFSPDNNMGGFNLLLSGTDGGGRRRRGLLNFDIASQLPSGATVTSATLQLSAAPPNNLASNFGLHRVLIGWNEGNGTGSAQGEPATAVETTWNSILHGTSLWNAPGGLLGTDIAAISSSTANVGPPGIYNWIGLANDVQSMFDDPGSDFGWTLISEAEATSGTARRFESRETGGFAPVLTVEFTPVPEPSGLLLALLGVGFYLSRRR